MNTGNSAYIKKFVRHFTKKNTLMNMSAIAAVRTAKIVYIKTNGGMMKQDEKMTASTML
jgi:hypothetical protein